MDIIRDSTGAQAKEAGVSWEAAQEMAASWLSPDDSSFEASVLTRGAIQLLLTTIYELGLSSGSPAAALAACRSFLNQEKITPGRVIARLLASKSPEVAAVAREVQLRGGGWVVTITPPRNAIVMTALINLPER